MAIRWDKFTVKSQEAIQAATNLALEQGNPELTPMHLLASLLEDKDGIIVPVLQKVGVPTEQLLARANDALSKLPKVGGRVRNPAFRTRCRRCWTAPSKRRQTSRTSTFRPNIFCWP